MLNNYDDFIQMLIEGEENVTPEMAQKKMELSSLEAEFLRRNGREVDEDNTDIIPFDYSISDDVDTKIQIVRDALEKQIPLQKSTYFPNILETAMDNEHFFK